MTFVALEGCDGTGKTTLANAVIAEIDKRRQMHEPDIEYWHFSQLDNDPLDEYALDFENYSPLDQRRHIVCDRLHIGEEIYGPLYREKSALGVAGFRWIELYLRAKGASVWTVTAPLEVIKTRLEERGEEYLQSHDVEGVWAAFSDIEGSSLLWAGEADTDKYTPEELAELIVDGAEYYQAAAEAIASSSEGYIGTATPHTLLVGDEHGPAEPGVTKAPFLPRGNSSGVFLLESLPDIWWHGVGIVNSKDEALRDLWQNLSEPNVVALGSKASERLVDEDVPHSVVPHPQKVRRFHHSKKDEYGILIRDISTQNKDALQWPNS